MGWADHHITRLRAGETISFRPRGLSMRPLVNDNDLCLVESVTGYQQISVDDIVLCRVNGRQYLHKVLAIDGDRLQIGNNRGGINGWTNRRNIFGRLVSVSR